MNIQQKKNQLEKEKLEKQLSKQAEKKQQEFRKNTNILIKEVAK